MWKEYTVNTESKIKRNMSFTTGMHHQRGKKKIFWRLQKWWNYGKASITNPSTDSVLLFCIIICIILKHHCTFCGEGLTHLIQIIWEIYELKWTLLVYMLNYTGCNRASRIFKHLGIFISMVSNTQIHQWTKRAEVLFISLCSSIHEAMVWWF